MLEHAAMTRIQAAYRGHRVRSRPHMQPSAPAAEEEDEDEDLTDEEYERNGRALLELPSAAHHPSSHPTTSHHIPPHPTTSHHISPHPSTSPHITPHHTTSHLIPSERYWSISCMHACPLSCCMHACPPSCCICMHPRRPLARGRCCRADASRVATVHGTATSGESEGARGAFR